MKVKWINLLTALGSGARDGRSVIKPYGDELMVDAQWPLRSADKLLALLIISQYLPGLMTDSIRAELEFIRDSKVKIPKEVPAVYAGMLLAQTNGVQSQVSGKVSSELAPPSVDDTKPVPSAGSKRQSRVAIKPQVTKRPTTIVDLDGWLDKALAMYLPAPLNPPKVFAKALVLAAAVIITADGEVEDCQVSAVVRAFADTWEIDKTLGVDKAVATLRAALGDLQSEQRAFARNLIYAEIVSTVADANARHAVYEFALEMAVANSRGVIGQGGQIVLDELHQALMS